jgi:hypothetical protein
MKNLATVPSSITENITSFCHSITSQHLPLYISSHPAINAKQGDCFNNAKNNLQSEDKTLNGWVIWQTSNHLLQAEFHCVIQHSNQSLECITPYHRKYSQILFLPEPDREYLNKRTPTRYLSTSDAKETQPFIDALGAIVYLEELLSSEEAKNYINDPVNKKKKVELIQNIHDMEKVVDNFERMILKNVGPNSLCICGSEKKFKKCCNKHQ